MSNSIGKHLPWMVPTAAILAVGSGFMDRINISFGDPEPAVAQVAPVATAPVIEQPDPAEAALAAVSAVTGPAPVEPEDVSDQLAALLQEPVAEDVDVTRAQGFAVTAAPEPTAEPVVVQPEPAAAVGADFFTAAQANIAQANSCMNDLRNLSAQSNVYFPSGALNGDAAGVAQARLIGKIAQRCPGVTIEVRGHSDASGNPAINLRLSQERAEAVIARVAAAGIDTSKMVAVGLGSSFPSGVTGPQPASYYDRRVDFSIVDSAQTASFTAPSFGSGTFQLASCVAELQAAADSTTISYTPGSVTASQSDLNAALVLAKMAVECPQARLRLVGQHAEEYGSVEDAGTGRLRAIALMTTLVGAGYDAGQLIMAAPSDSTPVQGLSNSRVDFDVILEEL